MNWLFGDRLRDMERAGELYVPENATCIVTGANAGLGVLSGVCVRLCCVWACVCAYACPQYSGAVALA